MLVLKEKDYLEVSVNSLIADYDRLTLTNLYQPIVGYKAISVYFTLLSEFDNQKINPIINHEVIFARTQMNAGEFVSARMRLEGIGLLKTFVSDLKGMKLYQYELYAPETPQRFFNNALFYGLLMQTIGEVEANKLKKMYAVKSQPEGKEITATFAEVYSPDYENPLFMKAAEDSSGDNIITRQSAKLATEFSYELFADALSKISQIKVESFSTKDMKELERLASLYGVSEECVADAVQRHYNPLAEKEKRLDFEGINQTLAENISFRSLLKMNKKQLSGEVFSETDLGRKINILEKCTPKQYLSIIQNGSIPSASDISIVNDISMKYHLQNGVINAIVDYVVTVNDNILSRPLAEKIAGSVARQGITTAIDTMNYLKKTSSRRRKNNKEPQEVNEIPQQNVVEDKPKKKLNKEELLKRIEEAHKNGEN